MTEPDAASPETPDFTIHRPPITFKIDGDTFSAPARMSPFVLKKLAAEAALIGDVSRLTDVASIIKAIDALSSVMVGLMPGVSGERFKARLESEGGPEDPPIIDLMQQGIPALYFLLERYGLRPTVPSSPSPTGLMDGQMSTPSDGTSSTDGPSPAESTSPDSASPTGSI